MSVLKKKAVVAKPKPKSKPGNKTGKSRLAVKVKMVKPKVVKKVHKLQVRGVNQVALPKKEGVYTVRGHLNRRRVRNYYGLNVPEGYNANVVLSTSRGRSRLVGNKDKVPTNGKFIWQTRQSHQIKEDGAWYLMVEKLSSWCNYVLKVILEKISSKPEPESPEQVPSPNPSPSPGPSPGDNAGSKEGNRYALIVGISDYRYISDLSYCDEDATDWYNYLKSRNYQIKLLGDNHRQNYPVYDGLASESNVRAAFKSYLQNAKSEDTVVFVTSGHGDGDGLGSSYLCLYSCDPNRDYDCYRDRELLADIKSAPNKPKIFMFVDHCFSGGLLDELTGLPNVTCLTTCTKKGYGYDNPNQKNGAWTYCYLQKGLIEKFGGNAPVAKVFEWAKTNYPKISGNTDRGDQPQMVNNLGDNFSI